MSVSWAQIDKAEGDAQRPVPDEWLEGLRANAHGKEQCFYVRFLYRLSLALKSALAVELGTQWGITSAFLCAAAAQHGGQVVGVDNAVEGKHLPTWYDGFTFLKMDSVDASAEVTGDVGLLFQDTPAECHAAEWEAWRPRMADGALWVCGFAAINGAWDQVPAKRKRKYPGMRGTREIGVIRL